MKNGRALVIGDFAFQLSTQGRTDDAAANDIQWTDADANTLTITSEFENGWMGSWVEMRDTDFVSYQDQVDLLAGTFVRDINNQHRKGYGLDDSTGNNFFTALQLENAVDRNNTGTASVTTAAIVDPENVSLHKYEITITGAGTFDVTDQTTGTTTTGEAFAAATDISFFLSRGMQVQLSAGTAVGDKFSFHAAGNAAKQMSVDSGVSTNTNKIAAGLTTDQGDGDNALAIAQLQNSLQMNKSTPATADGTATFSEYYNSVVGQVGVAGKTAIEMFNQQESINFELENRHEQIAGVSLDEEMVNLIKFQHAYQASARLIGVVDELLQTLIALGR
jgi:flagellar hook-associated protein 1 FlgK